MQRGRTVLVRLEAKRTRVSLHGTDDPYVAPNAVESGRVFRKPGCRSIGERPVLVHAHDLAGGFDRRPRSVIVVRGESKLLANGGHHEEFGL